MIGNCCSGSCHSLCRTDPPIPPWHHRRPHLFHDIWYSQSNVGGDQCLGYRPSFQIEHDDDFGVRCFDCFCCSGSDVLVGWSEWGSVCYFASRGNSFLRFILLDQLFHEYFGVDWVWFHFKSNSGIVYSRSLCRQRAASLVGGYLLPGIVSEMLEPVRDFAHLKLPQAGLPSIAALSRYNLHLFLSQISPSSYPMIPN